jgi:hypothetical protein
MEHKNISEKYDYYCAKYPENTQLKGKVLSHFTYGIYLDIGEEDPDFTVFVDWYNLFLPVHGDLSLYPPIGSEIICFVNCFNIKGKEVIEMRVSADDTYFNSQLSIHFDILTQKYPLGSQIPCIVNPTSSSNHIYVYCSLTESIYTQVYLINKSGKKLAPKDEVFARVAKVWRDNRYIMIKCFLE